MRLPNGADTEINCVALLSAPKNIRNETQSATKSSESSRRVGNRFNFVPIEAKVVKSTTDKAQLSSYHRNISLFVDSLRHSQDLERRRFLVFVTKKIFLLIG
jgi:hypothetical protein